MSLDFITAQLFINSLLRNEEFEVYDKPLEKIMELCNNTKKIIEKYQKREFENGIPPDFPIKLSENAFSTATAKIIKNEWDIINLSQKERMNILKSIEKKYKDTNVNRRKYILEELKKETNDRFLLELNSLGEKELKEKLRMWTAFDVEKMLGAVGETKEKKRGNMDPTLKKFIDKVYTHPKVIANKNIMNDRDNYTEKIGNLFNKTKDFYDINKYNHEKGIKVTYTGKFPPTDYYIHSYFLPWLLLEVAPLYRKKYGVEYKAYGVEKNVYEKFIEDYEKLAYKKSSRKIIEDEKCKGLYYIDNVIPKDMVKIIFDEIEKGNWTNVGNEKSRVVQHFGYKYNYVSGDIREKSDPMPKTIVYMRDLLKKICLELKIIDENYEFNQCIINKYEPGQGISAHIDDKKYGGVVASFTIGGGAMMVFQKNDETHNIYVKSNSLYIMSGDARYKYKHSMPARKSDDVMNKEGNMVKIQRRTRISITFRTVPNS